MKIHAKPFIEIFVSKKGNKCACLKYNLGYAKKAVTFDTALIAELLGISVPELMSKDIGQYEC